MRRDKYPPESSAITLTESSAGMCYSWPAGPSVLAKNVVVTVLTALLMVAWLVAGIFCARWLAHRGAHDGASVIGVVFVVVCAAYIVDTLWTISFNVKRLRPASLLLDRGNVVYETGTRRPAVSLEIRRSERKKKDYKGTRNRTYRFSSGDLNSLQLEEMLDRRRLSVVHEGQQVEIGDSLSGADKEWLLGLLQSIIPER